MAHAYGRKKSAPRAAPDAPILVVTGMKREAACARGEGVATLCSGADAAKLRAALETLGETPFSAVISFGLAGGLDYDLRAGDVVVADAALAGGGRHETHPRLSHLLREGLTTVVGKAVSGAVLGVDQPAMNPDAKRALRDSSQAIAVDMESHVAAEFAHSRKVPFAIVRAISDPAARTLPPLAAKAVTPDGDVDLGLVAREIMRDPKQIGGLVLAGMESRAAFASLGRCGPLLGPLLRLVLADL
jgi:hopanoid-associated phosphorylase